MPIALLHANAIVSLARYRLVVFNHKFGLIAHFAKVPNLWIGTGVSVGIAGLYALWTAIFSEK